MILSSTSVAFTAQEHLEVEVVAPIRRRMSIVGRGAAWLARTLVHRRPARCALDLVALERHELLASRPVSATFRALGAPPARPAAVDGRRARLEPRRVAVLVERHAELADVLRTFAAQAIILEDMVVEPCSLDAHVRSFQMLKIVRRGDDE